MKRDRLLLFAGLALVALPFFGCKQYAPTQTQAETKWSATPYTDLQNKYVDLALNYEENGSSGLRKNMSAPHRRMALEEKIERLLALSERRSTLHTKSLAQGNGAEDEEADEAFYDQLYQSLMAEVNAHPEVQRALKETEDEEEPMDMLVVKDGMVCSKMELLKNFENGVASEWDDESYGDNDSDSAACGNNGQRAVRYTPHLKWKSTINYRFDGNVNANYRTQLRKAMTTWEIAADHKFKFVEIANKRKSRFLWAMGWSYHVYIKQKYIPGEGGHSTLGRVPWAAITLSDPDERTYLHELGHTLGLLHEHERYDRDNYVTIYWDNIRTGCKSQFYKKTKTIGACYGEFDYKSIMMYPSRAMSKNGSCTMLKKDLTEISRTTQLSARDNWAIKEIYK